MDNFYYNAVNTICANNGGKLQGCKGDNLQQLLLMGAAFKGFDDFITQHNPGAPGWYQARVTTQGCGTTWLSSWAEMKKESNWFSAQNNPLPYMMVETWDDYEEGSEIETGIDNCLQNYGTSLFKPTVNGAQLGWSYSFDKGKDLAGVGTTATVDHYDLYYTTDQTNYVLLDRTISNTQAGCSEVYPDVQCTGVNLSNYNLSHGTLYTLAVEAVGKPGVTNWMSRTINYTP